MGNLISASYKTDIPAFYGEWFVNRLNAGYCKVLNPYNRRAFRVDLTPEAVDGIVFWTKNIGPFLQHLPHVRELGFPFIIQYTITGYPRELESSVVQPHRSVEHMKTLADLCGPRVAVWRYDTIIFTSLTDRDFHLRRFESLAKDLEGTTDQVIISFAQFYKKTLRNMNWAAHKFNFTWYDPPIEEKHELTRHLVQIANAHGMEVAMCGQPELVIPGVVEARCIDPYRLSDVAGRPIVAKHHPHRSTCQCYASKDIGAYDTCPHGCVYCYAVQNRDLARRRYKEHDPESELLYTPEGYVPEEDVAETRKPVQNSLF